VARGLKAAATDSAPLPAWSFDDTGMKKLKRFVRDLVRNRMFWIVTLIVAVALISGNAILLFERAPDREEFQSVSDGIWWAVVTMTTVGYGDHFPITGVGRLIGVGLMFSSIILVSLFTATVSSIFVARKIQEGKGLESVNFEDHVLICGWNVRASRTLETLNGDESGTQVALINQLAAEDVESMAKEYANLEIRFIRGDFTREEVLERANIRQAGNAILLPDRSDPTASGSPDQQTILAAHVIRSINPEIKVFAHLLDEEHAMDLKRAEVDGVVISDAYAGELLADYVISPGTPQLIDHLVDDRRVPNVRRVPVPEQFVGKRSMDLFIHLKEANDQLLLGYVSETPGMGLEDEISGGNRDIIDLIKRKVSEAGIKTRMKSRVNININPPGDYTIREGDHAIVICGE
jgi:voltage-gated potassium channel